MNALNIDTLKFARSLKAAGADDRLAEAIAEGVAGADTSQFSTKTDVAELKTEIAGVKAELKTEIAGLRGELKTDIAAVRTDMAAMKSELVRMNWITSIGIVAAMFTMLRFFTG
ncbi:hypothetical protein [Jannaschia sp. LMIT008]|uniref:hypothetical protein n=1 Tax=Jannaschia maritima TaxID=3032585 RepID=UPI002811ADB0|nr:hypothetical protein [Jannaschia sp. LMIT008]